MGWYSFTPYVSAGERKAKALLKIKKLTQAGKKLSPVTLEGRAIAKTFWGKAWCDNIESYGDYENRLPRGRTYVRNGSVIDLQISRGKIEAQIMGSDHYHGHIHIAPLSAKAWEKIKSECSGKIDSVIELLRGELSQSVMEVITRRDGGLFPKPSEIKLNCSCPDWAELCKHLAAVLYGVGARLDARPDLLFLLRGVDHMELIAEASSIVAAGTQGDSTFDANLSEIFGIEIAKAAPSTAVPVRPPKPKTKKSTLRPKKSARGPQKKTSPAKKSKPARKRQARRRPGLHP